MRKILVGLILAALSSFGLVSLGTSTAQAAECPYTGCVETDARINGPATANPGVVTFRIKVVALSGTANPKGTILVFCERPGKRKAKVREYNREPREVSFFLGKRTEWSCGVRFSSDGKFLTSRDRTQIVID